MAHPPPHLTSSTEAAKGAMNRAGAGAGVQQEPDGNQPRAPAHLTLQRADRLRGPSCPPQPQPQPGPGPRRGDGRRSGIC